MRYDDRRPKDDEPEQGGVPDWVLSPRFLLLLALPVYLIAQPALKAGARLFTPTPVERSCFPLNGFGAYEQGTGRLARYTLDAEGEAKDVQVSANKLLDAMDRCGLDDCPASARKGYYSSLIGYASKKERMIRRLDREHGEAGLVAAADIYSSPDNVAITRDLTRRWNTGWFESNRLGDERDVIRLTVTLPVDQVLPCRD